MESYPLLPHSTNVHVALFSVRNAQALRTRLVTASTLTGDVGDAERERVRFTFIDAAMISSRLHLLTAVNQALLADASGSLATHNIHSEVVWMLEPGTNVRRFKLKIRNQILNLSNRRSPIPSRTLAFPSRPRL